MDKLIVAKFGGSAIGMDGEGLPTILNRVKSLKSDSKVIIVCSAPLTKVDGKKNSLTDVMLELGKNAADGKNVTMKVIEQSYSNILQMVNDEHRVECKKIIDEMLALASESLTYAKMEGKFEDEIRAKALAYSGEVLMSHVLNYILKSNDIEADSIALDDWPIITDNNIESTNFLFEQSNQCIEGLNEKIKQNEVDDNILYRFKRIIQYNDKTSINDIYNSTLQTTNDFIKIVNCATLDDMDFDDSIELFENLNAIFFLYKERNYEKKQKKTRKNKKIHKD